MPENMLEIGKITSVFGIKGEVKVQPWCDSPELLCEFETLYWKSGTPVNIERARVQKNMAILKIEGVDDANEAQKLRNHVLYMDRADVELEEGSYFIADLIGLRVLEGEREIGVIREILTIASMIEKETDGTDRTTIASVIYNRLNNPGASTAGYLQIDATIQYVLPEGKIVQESDYQGVDSPYNTYKNKGLPPGPIANPGMESITAALNPQSTNYYYYALGDDHLHHFFSSYAEH